jgi:hypothetical protein
VCERERESESVSEVGRVRGRKRREVEGWDDDREEWVRTE